MSALAERLARSLPAASFELETLIRLVGIVETTETKTASVTCTHRARLLINPEFVAEYCQRDEHLFLLVMHEMWHVLMGHTTLYARPTTAHNIAFDALINAGLARQHQEPEYRGFFEALNPPDQFPALLLRPPVGWPKDPRYRVPGPRGTREILERLYPRPDSKLPEPTYDEILALVNKAQTTDMDAAVLVGDHEGSGTKDGTSDPMNDEFFGEIVREIVGKWPPPPIPLAGRDQGSGLRGLWVERRPNTQPIRREFVNVLATVLQPDRGGAAKMHFDSRRITVGPGPLPNPKDRQLPARRRLHSGLVLANQEVVLRTRIPERPQRALVYLDVSGSMISMLPHFVDLLTEPARQGRIRVKQFSTEIAPISPEALAAGDLTTTHGTDIACVLEDIVSERCQRVLVITDGYVGKAPEPLLAALQTRDIACTALLNAGGWTEDLAPYMTIHHLSPLEYH
jgi:hypothetical protein